MQRFDRYIPCPVGSPKGLTGCDYFAQQAEAGVAAFTVVAEAVTHPQPSQAQVSQLQNVPLQSGQRQTVQPHELPFAVETPWPA